jgi:hypothetical protein
LADRADETVVMPSADPAVVQDIHLLRIQQLGAAIEDHLDQSDGRVARSDRPSGSDPVRA